MAAKTKVLILGGGFGGVAAAQELSKNFKNDPSVEITLVNRDNYFVFVPLLASAAAGSIETMHVVAPIRRLIPNVRFRAEEITAIDLNAKSVTTASPVTGREHKLSYDHLVVALGNVINLERLPGVAQHGKTIKTLGDALSIRNHVLQMLEAADIETDPGARREMLTFVVAGGGFSGVEMVGEMNDLIREAIENYPSISEEHVKVILLHSRERILPEMGPDIADYALNQLRKRGVEVRLNIRVAGATPHEAILADGRNIPTRTLIVAVGNAPPPVVERLDAKKERGKLVVDEFMRVPDRDGVWALGDIAIVPNRAAKDGSPSPPTAQYAIRQGKALAKNIAASIGGGQPKPFAFGGLGLLCVVGHGAGVGELPLGIKTKGLLGWILWRSVYWSKVPNFGRKLQIGAGWLMDVFLKRDIAQINLSKSQTVGRAHYEAGEYIFRQGEPGTHFYMISSGEVEVVRERSSGKHEILATLGAGEYFGETSLLTKGRRNASVRCAAPTDVITIGRDDFAALAGAWSQLAGSLKETSDERTEAAPLTGFLPIVDISDPPEVSEAGTGGAMTKQTARLRRDDGADLDLDRELTTFGRDAENHIVVNDPRASRRHALIQRSEGAFWVEDLESSNGVWLNEGQVNERAALKNGDVIRIGRTSFVFQLDSGSLTGLIEGLGSEPRKAGNVTGMIENLDAGRPKPKTPKPKTPNPKEPPRRGSERTSRDEPAKSPSASAKREGPVTGMIHSLDAEHPKASPSRDPEPTSREGTPHEEAAKAPRRKGSVTGMIEGLDAKPPGKKESPPPERTPREEQSAPKKNEGSVTGAIGNLNAEQSGGGDPHPPPENERVPEEGSVTGMLWNLDSGGTEPKESVVPKEERPIHGKGENLEAGWPGGEEARPANARPSEEKPADAPKEGSLTGMIHGLDAPPSNKTEPASEAGRERRGSSEVHRGAGGPKREGSLTGMIHGLDAPGRERLERAAEKPEDRKAGSEASLWLGGKSFGIGGGASVLGRDPECGIAVEDSRVSWRHAAVKLEGGSYVVEDLGSRNGTWLNEERIGGRTALRDEDVVRVGATQFVFREGSGRAAPDKASPSSKEGSITGMIRSLDVDK